MPGAIDVGFFTFIDNTEKFFWIKEELIKLLMKLKINTAITFKPRCFRTNRNHKSVETNIFSVF